MMLVKHDTGAPRFGIVILGVAVILVTVVGVKYLYIFDTAALGEQVDMAIPGITALPRAGISRFTDPEIVTPLDDLVDPAADLTCCHVVKALFVEHDHVVDVHLFPVQLVRPQQFHEQPIRGSPDNFVHAMKIK